ncbi:MAG: hypothetical protein LBC02_01840 [Planctomycetaceae bacterium]|jgi:hypothetical protein|nr:hypothetical protein [Planctomycetaceae bacterium]
MSKQNIRRLQFLLGSGILLLFLFLLFLPSVPLRPVGAQPVTGESYKELDDKIRIFFDQLIIGNTTNAFENLLLQSPFASSSAPAAEIRTKLDETKKHVGEFHAYELYQVKPVGKDIVLIRCILKCEFYPVIWTFTYYRKPSLQGSTGTSWQLIELRFDSNLDL